MFTGLIENIGEVVDIQFKKFGAKLSYTSDFKNIKKGASIAVNGACLSVVDIKDNIFTVDIMQETLNKTNLKNLKKGDKLNLETSLTLSKGIDGHIVSGHIDDIAKLISIKNEGDFKILTFECNTDLIILKGSIAINGISLTICDLKEKTFSVSIIPDTINNTNLKYLKTDDIVNIEYDMIGKYVKKFIEKKENTSKITLDFLKENGF